MQNEETNIMQKFQDICYEHNQEGITLLLYFMAKLVYEIDAKYKEKILKIPYVPFEELSSDHMSSISDTIVDVLIKKDLTPEQLHFNWVEQKKEEGWVYGESYSEEEKTHPLLMDYEDLNEAQKISNIIIVSTVRTMKDMVYPDVDFSVDIEDGNS